MSPPQIELNLILKICVCLICSHSTDGLDLETYETYVKDVRNEYWGYDRGWDRYIDDLIGW